MRSLRLWLALLFVALLAPLVSATIVPAFPLRQLAVEAHDVLRGHVVDERMVYDPMRDRIYTHTTVEVTEDLRGLTRGGQRITVRQIGGVLGDRETRVVGTAFLSPGAEVVIFARTDGRYHYLVGMAQGAYDVIRSQDTEPVLARGVGHMTQIFRTGPVAATAPERLELSTLRRLVTAEGREE